MRGLHSLVSVAAALFAATVSSQSLPADDAAHRVFPAGQVPPDARLAPLRHLRDKDHPWQPPETLSDWEQERDRIRRQLLVATGLWPMPEKAPLNPVVHGLVQRDGYTVERVFFASRPGVYVTGSLYRPDGDPHEKHPAVLCPHGHWKDGRFYDAGDDDAKKQIESGAETFDSAAHFPLQARMVQLARMGCVVFFYDMIGYADNGPLDHRTGFNDVQAESWSQNIMGLQTWNSIRALDFVASLPDVDPTRIGVTGASGGGTQTFMLCAIDPRPAVAFPAVMVSTNMQGGCVCENASWLRVGINNVAIAACFAPKPMAMSGADDWTIDIESKGLPELKHVYGLYGQAELVHAQCFPQFPHNYNQVSRNLMYEWFNQHLRLGAESPIVERDFQPLTREEATVFTAEHPRPSDVLAADELRRQMTDESRAQAAALIQQSATDPSEYQRLVGGAAETMFGSAPSAKDVEFEETGRSPIPGGELTKGFCGRADAGERIPYVLLLPTQKARSVVMWIDGRGKAALFDPAGQPIEAVTQLLKSGRAIASADLFLTGEYLSDGAAPERKVDATFPGYTFGYNRPVIAERVRDILTLAALAQSQTQAGNIELVGTGAAGPWVLLARGLAGDRVDQTLANLDGFSFLNVTDLQDPQFLPAANRFGGIGGLTGLGRQGPIELFGPGEATAPPRVLLTTLNPQTTSSPVPLTPEIVAERLAKSP